MSEKTKVIKLATSATRVLGPVASASPASSSSSAAQPAAAAAASSASPSSSAAARAAGPPANATDASSSSRSGGGSSNSSSSSNNAADTSSSGSSNSRREVWAAVARNRAAFFATGAGSGSSDTGAAQAAAAAAASSSSVGPAPGGREHWPGPFATARQLLQNRDAAKAARESESASPGAKRKSGSSASGSSASKRARGAGSTAEKGDYDDGTTEVDEVPLEGGIYPSHYAPTWQPSRALPGSSNSAAVDDATISSDDGGPSPTSSPAAKSSSSSSKGAASNAKSDGTAERSRRAMAVAGRSGVRLSIPPLSVLCMEALNGFLQHCEDLGELMPDTRRRFAESVCRSRTMDGHAFSLFAAASSDELVVPDCAGVDEATMTSSLSATSGLTRLELGQCGRGLTDRAMKAIAPKAFSNLRHLSLGGPHVLSDAVLVQALKHAPQLRHLRIAASPVIAGAFIAELPSILPELESLEIEACSRVSDDELRGMVSLADLVPVNSAAAAASSSAVAGAGAGALTSSSSSSSSAKKKTKTSSPPIAANLATNDEHSALPAAVSADELEGETVDVSGSAANEGPTSVLSDQPLDGIFKLKRLSKVTLAQLPHVTDAVMVDLFITLGPSLTSLRIDRCEKVGAPSIVALAESCPNLRSLELQNLQAVPAEPFRMVRCASSNCKVAIEIAGPQLQLNTSFHVSSVCLVFCLASCSSPCRSAMSATCP